MHFALMSAGRDDEEGGANEEHQPETATMMKSIRFSIDRKGRPIAHAWTRGREFRVGLDAARLAVETGVATEVIHGPAPMKCGVKVVRKEPLPNGGVRLWTEVVEG